MTQRITHGDEIHRLGSDRNGLRPAHQQFDGGGQYRALHHAPARIDPGHVTRRAHQARRLPRRQAGSDPDIGHSHAGRQAGPRQGPPPIPGAGPQSHDALHPVVIDGRPVEEPSDPSVPVRLPVVVVSQGFVRYVHRLARIPGPAGCRSGRHLYNAGDRASGPQISSET